MDQSEPKFDEIKQDLSNSKSFWYADWSFPIIVGLLSAAIFAGTSMYFNYGVGAFNEIAFVSMLKAGMTGGSYGACAAFGISFLFARVLEGSLDGVLDLGGAILTGVGLGMPAILLSFNIKKPLQSFPLALVTGAIIGILIGLIIYSVRHYTSKQASSTFGADILMGAGNETGRFLGPLIIISACQASMLVGVGAIIGAALFYKWNKSITIGAIIGAMIMGFFFPINA